MAEARTKVESPEIDEAEAAMAKSAEAASALADTTKEREEEARLRLQHIRDIAERETEIFVELAEELYEINKKALFHHMVNPSTGDKYSSFKEFALEETWFGSERTASYLMAIWDYYVVQEGEGDRAFLDSIKHLGWSKLREMIGFLDTENLEEVMQVVDGPEGQMSKRDIVAMVKEQRAAKEPGSKKQGGDDDPGKSKSPSDADRDKLKQVKFRLYEHQKSNLDIAIEKAKNIRETDSDAEALDIISLEFISLHAADDKESMVDIMSAMEASLGGKLVLFKRDGAHYVGKGEDGGDKPSERAEALFEVIEDQMGVTISVIQDGELVYAPGLNEDDSQISQLSNTLSAMEEAADVKLIAYKDGEFLYGADTLRSLAEK